MGSRAFPDKQGIDIKHDQELLDGFSNLRFSYRGSLDGGQHLCRGLGVHEVSISLLVE